MKEDAEIDPAATRAMPTASRAPVAGALHKSEGASGSGRLEVRCPNCHSPTEVAVDTSLTDLTCGSCGSHFSLVDQSKATRMAPSLSKLGRFELIERLGVGGFGSVWKARDKELDRTVAIKIPRAGAMSGVEQEQFFREARAAAQLRHPSIVSVHEVGRDGDSVYIVSDFVRGATLGDWLTGQQLTNREAAELCAKIADALHHAHEQGIIHRDLKPANIMMDGDNQPHLMDFGLARREVGEVTVTMDGQVLGTPAYMSPEQARGEAHVADRRSDVYSLGAMLFQLLTGELPFRGNARMLIKQVIDDEPPSPRKLNSNVSKDLETITLKCLEKEPAKRFQTANEFADECRRYLSGDPIHARPISRFARGWRWAKRRPAAAALLAVLAGVAVVGPVVATQQALLRVQRDRLLADVAAQKDELQSQVVRSLFDHGTSQCEAGRFSQAVAFFAGACAMAAPDDPLRASARNLAAGWAAGLGRTFVHDSFVSAVAFSPDGRTVLTGSYDRTARLWDVATGNPVGEPLRHGSPIFAVAFSPDGHTLLTGSRATTARLWDAATGRPTGGSLHHEFGVKAVAFSPDGRTVLTGSFDHTARLWEAVTGNPVGDPLRHDGMVEAVAFSPDGRAVLTGSADKTARLWDAATGKPICEPLRHDGRVHAVAFSPDGRSVLTGSADKTARLWDAATGEPFGVPLRNDDAVNSVAFSPDGRTVLTGSDDYTARLWDVAMGKPTGEPLRHDGGVWAVTFSPDGHTILTGSYDHTARLWDVATGNPVGEPLRHGSPIFAVAFSPDGRTVLTGSGDRTARLWDAATGKPIGDPFRHDGIVEAVAFSPDGREVLTGSVDKTARLWDAATGKPIGDPFRHDDMVLAVAFSPDGRTVLTGSGDRTARLWQVTTGKPIGKTLRHDDVVRAVAFSPDGRTVLTGSDDLNARLWDAATGKQIGQPLRHDHWVYAVAFSPDGRTLLTGCKDKTARLWDAATGKPIGEPLRHDDAVKAVAFSPNGRTLLTGSYDKTARLWQVPQLPDNSELVNNWAAAKTGLSLDAQGYVRHLSQAEWLKAREELEKLRANVELP